MTPLPHKGLVDKARDLGQSTGAMDSGQGRQWTLDDGGWTMNNGQWTMDNIQRTELPRLKAGIFLYSPTRV